MLVITLQFSYTQETIYNALMKTMLKKKKSHCPTVKVLTAVKINTLHCPANEQRKACHANVALLSSVYVLMTVCPSPCFSATVLSLKKKKRKKRNIKNNMPVH